MTIAHDDADGDTAEAVPAGHSDLRAALVVAGFLALTLPLMPVQAVLLRLAPGFARRFPCWYHRQVCRLIGIRVHTEGAIARDRPVLIVSNHVSWLDIPVLSSLAPLSFVAKKEVGGWPLVAQLARLQRSVFVDRERRTLIGETTNEMAERLAAGDTLVLFAEGTSSDGLRVLPFKSSLFAAVKPPRARTPSATAFAPGAVVQTLAIAYTHVHGLPLGSERRALIGWYGDMAMGSHAWELLGAGPIDVHVVLGEPVPLDAFPDRKALADHSETLIRRAVARLQREKTQRRS